ncbi:MAG: hypothetical protein GXC78_07215 [Chitinophagaceae bacterium]|nr:hypothetical protein [Chitinophagaceae bacterium]
MKKLLFLLIIAGFTTPALAQNWTTTGNSGLSTSNFIGNTDSVALIFRTNNTERARLSANGNFMVGLTSDGGYRVNISGGIKTSTDLQVNGITIGKGTGTGTHNTIMGNSAFINNQTGLANVGIGSYALRYNKSGGNNTVLGYMAAGANTDDTSLASVVSIGAYSRAYGQWSTAIGANARSDKYAIAMGYNSNATSLYGLAIGFAANVNGGVLVYGSNSSATHSGSMVIGGGMSSTANYQLLIGNATPGYSVRDVFIGGGVTQTLAATYGPLTIQPTGQSGTDQTGQTIRIATGKGTGAGTSGDIHLMTSVPTTSGTTLQSLSTSVIVKGSGNVGIGTTSPSAQLHTTGSVRLAGLTMDSTRIRVLVADNNGNIAYRNVSTIGGGSGSISGTVNYLAKYSSGTTIGNSLLFDNGTGVGIGTISINDTAYRLFVEKGIRTRKIKVDVSSWADYVFEKEYKLPSLKEVARFIDENKRLPEMPDAATATKEGVDLADNQVLLLKKIEELTLYMIEMDKKTDRLEAENASLRKELEQLKKK